MVTVDGTPALKVKYDILGLKGITAYADGSLSGGFSGALVDLVDVAVTNLASGDILKYNGTHFVNVPVSSIAGASSWDQITGKPEYYPTRWADVSGAPTSLPASDVYPWAKAASKPTYTAAEVGALALSGGVLAGDVYLGGGLAIRDNTASHFNVIGLLNTDDGTFFTAVGSGSRRMVLYSSVDLYRDNGSTQYRIYDSGNFNPSSKLDKSVWDEAFELKTVNGVRVISAKLDFLSVAGISAYATGPSSGGGGGGLDYDLLKQALTGAITPDGYPFTISASFLGAIDKTYLTGKLANTYANKVHTHLWVDITDRPTALPANGGNADTVDNLHASSFAQIKSYNFPSGGINNITDLDFTGNIQAHFPGAEYSCIWQGKDYQGTILQLKLRDYANVQSMMYRGSLTKTWRTVWDSSNFNPDDKFGFSADQLSDLNNAPNNAFFVGAYNAANAPVAGSWSNGFTISYGNNPDFRKQFVYAGDKWWTRGRDGVNWGTWRQIWDSGNFNPGNYLLLSGGTMTGDISFGSNGRSLRGSDGGNIAGVLYDTPNARYVTAIGTGSRRLILVSPASIYRGAGGVAENYMIYDSGNFNPSSKLDKSVWDEAFELKTVNGVRVISAKLDFLSVAGISAYATGPSSGGGGGGLDYDLLKQALTGAITPDGYPFTISASFLGAIDKTYLTGKLANTYANKVHTHLWVDITDRPTALPANGGNADTVDNLHASSFAQIKSYNFPSGGINNITDLDFTGNIQAHFPGAEYSCIWQGKDYQGTILQLKLRDYANVQSMMYRGSLTKTWRTVWDSSNFNPDDKFGFSADQLSDLNNAPNNAFFVGAYNAANAPVAGSWSNGFTISYGNNPDFRKQFVYAGDKWWTRGRDGVNWGTWRQIWDSGNFNPGNYLPLSGNKMITGDFQFKDGVSVRDAAGRSVVGLLDVAGDGVCVVVGNSAKKTRIVTPNDTPVYRNDGKGAYRIYDSSNSNISTVDWAAKNITAAGTVTAPTFVGALSGTATRCYGLAINNSAGESNCLQFMQTLSQNDAGDLPNSNWYHILKFNHGNGDTYYNRTLALPFYSDDIYTRRRVSGTAYSWVALFGEHNANRSDTNWTANTLTATKLVLGGITIDVYNGALRVNGNLVATGGVTAYQ